MLRLSVVSPIVCLGQTDRRAVRLFGSRPRTDRQEILTLLARILLPGDRTTTKALGPGSNFINQVFLRVSDDDDTPPTFRPDNHRPKRDRPGWIRSYLFLYDDQAAFQEINRDYKYE